MLYNNPPCLYRTSSNFEFKIREEVKGLLKGAYVPLIAVNRCCRLVAFKILINKTCPAKLDRSLFRGGGTLLQKVKRIPRGFDFPFRLVDQCSCYNTGID